MVYNKFYVNNEAYDTLSSSISSSTTTIVVSGDGSQFAGSPAILTLIAFDGSGTITKRERIKMTSRSWNSLTVTRWQYGTTALAFAAGDSVFLNVTAEVIKDIQDEVASMGQRITATEDDIDSLEAGEHSHTNKTILDGTQQSYTTAHKNKLDGLHTVATSWSYNDLANKPTVWSISVLQSWLPTSTSAVTYTHGLGLTSSNIRQYRILGVTTQSNWAYRLTEYGDNGQFGLNIWSASPSTYSHNVHWTANTVSYLGAADNIYLVRMFS